MEVFPLNVFDNLSPLIMIGPARTVFSLDPHFIDMPLETKSTLLQQISQVRFLKEAWRLLNTSREKSSGLSRVTIKDYESNLNSNLKSLSSLLSSGTYKFSAVKGVALKKKNKGHRPLMISEIQDRVVHKALALKLDSRLTKKYKLKNECSFAYQKGLSIQDAIIQMVSYYQQGYIFILEADIQSFFPTVNNSLLLEKIYKDLPDSSLNDLLQGSLNQELGNIEELKQKDIKIYNDIFSSAEGGIPQGNALSPLLANVYLSDFDHRMIKEGIKMIRYADDFIIMCKNKEDAKSSYKIAVDELEIKLNLKLYPLKDKGATTEKISRILNPKESIFSFLSVKFDGNKCSVIDKKIISLISKIQELADVENHKTNFPNQELGLLQVLTKVKNSLEGWIAAYNFLEIENQLKEIDRHVDIILFNIFKEFGFAIKKGDLSKIITQKAIKVDDNNTVLKRNGNKKLGLNPKQRRSSGVPLCLNTYYNSINGMMTFQQRVDAKTNGLTSPSKKKLNRKMRVSKEVFN